MTVSSGANDYSTLDPNMDYQTWTVLQHYDPNNLTIF